MAKLLLIRHGQTDWNATGRVQGCADPPLDPTGHEQARRLAHRLADEDHAIVAVYTSPLLRAYQTGQAIAQQLGLPIEADDRLKETDVGQLTGLTSPEIEQQFPDWVARRNTSQDWLPYPGGEDYATFAQRVMAAMADVVASHPQQTSVVIGHSGTMNIYLARLLEMPTYRRPPFHFENTSLSIVSIDGQRIRVHKLNDAWHLVNHEG